jgi:hypothetical protein
MTNHENSRQSAKTRQEKAMIEQFSRPDRPESEQRDWQMIRRAAAARKLMA